jgi:hypothetical protein
MMATPEDEYAAVGALLDTSQTLTVPQRQSPGPMLHDVYRERDDGSLECLDIAVEVKGRGIAGRREAVRIASDKLTEDARYGTFRTVKHGEMSDPIVRAQKIEPVDVWS